MRNTQQQTNYVLLSLCTDLPSTSFPSSVHYHPSPGVTATLGPPTSTQVVPIPREDLMHPSQAPVLLAEEDAASQLHLSFSGTKETWWVLSPPMVCLPTRGAVKDTCMRCYSG